MKRVLCFLLMHMTTVCVAQNLVPNPSFENYLACPSAPGSIPLPSETITSLEGWYRPTGGTSDYLNICAPFLSYTSVPDNLAGHQMPRTGNAYTGCYTSLDFGDGSTNTYREYIESELSTPLVPGHRYLISFWVNLSDWSPEARLTGCDRLGAYFSVDPVEMPMFFFELVYDAQFTSPEYLMLTDTGSWTNLHGTFTAADASKWMTLGSFIPYADMNFETISEGTGSLAFTYYYYDDICLLDLDGTPAEVTVADTNVCPIENAVLTGRDNAEKFEWDNGDTTRIRTISSTGTYWVKSVDIDSCLLTVDTFHVSSNILPYPVNLGNDTNICPADTLVLNAYNAVFDQYSWSTGAGTPSIKASSAGSYYVTASSECYIGSDTVNITLIPPPHIELPSDTTLCSNSLIDIGTDIPGVYYLWSTGADTCCISISDTGTYTLTITNICGATDSDEIRISNSGCSNCIMAPNVFSPNNDGINDAFRLLVNCSMQTYRLNIFNRWGQLVFTTTKVDEGWDGTFNGNRCDAGTYFYQVEAMPVVKRIGKISSKGDVILIR